MRHRRIPSPIAVLLAAVLLASIAQLAAATRCPVPTLPRPTETPAEAMARLEAEGLWPTERVADRTPPPDPQVGDTWLWYVWDLGGFPVADLKPCTVRGMGDNIYVVVDDDEWNVGIDQAEVDIIVNRFDNESVGSFPEQGIWDLNTGHFGPPPNPLDNLDRIFFFYYRFNIAADGFFWSFDQYPDGSQPFASNECDVVYLAVDNGQPAGDYMVAVGAHEFEHMIHFARDMNEDAWVDEGLGELAMWLFGNPDTISVFPSNPDNGLVVWNGGWADYIKTYLWSLYVYEQFGGQPFIWDVIHSPLNGLSGYQTVLTNQGHGVTTGDVFGNWGVANYLDDPSVPDGEFGYVGDDMPPFNAWRVHSTYPQAISGTVNAYGTDYVRLTNLGGAAPVVEFNGMDTRDWQVTLMAIDDVLPSLVREMTLDGAQDGSYTFAEAQGYDEVVFAVANVHPTTVGTYSYTADLAATGAPVVPAVRAALAASPNPFNPRTELSVTLPADGHARLRVHDAAGRIVATLRDARTESGTHAYAWDAGDLPSGVYLAALELDGKPVAQTKITLLK